MTVASSESAPSLVDGRGRRILFIQHAGALGGSAFSLLFTMQGLREHGFCPEVALLHPAPDMQDLYRDAGFVVHRAQGISIFTHTTGGYARPGSPASLRQLMQQLGRWRTGQEATIELVRSVRPDLVHLNSVVLMPSAQALRHAGIPHAWHIRECPPDRGWRTRLIGRELTRHSSVIFISEHDRREWVAGKHGVVIPNFVDNTMYERAPDKQQARRILGLPHKGPVLLYLGGTTGIKGFSVLLQALSVVRHRFPEIIAAMPGAELRPSVSRAARLARSVLPRIGWGTAGQRLQRRIAQLGLQSTAQLLPFAKDILPWLAACDLLVFPSIAPHFARPVIEAAAMGRPAIGSDIGGVRELIEHNRTGLLVPPNDARALANAVIKLLSDPALAAGFAEAGSARARSRYDQHTNVMSLVSIYQRLLPLTANFS